MNTNANGPRKILVVDDEPTIRRTLASLLTRNGHSVDTADNGRSALELLEKGGYALVITDVAMPDVGGIELLGVVRRLHLPVAAVVMTAYGAEDVAIQAIRQGAVDYFRKPLDLRKVIARVQEVLEQSRDRERREEVVERLRTEHAALGEKLRRHEKALGALAGRYASHAKQVLLGEAAATLTHEINNPLNIIQGRLQILREERDKDDVVCEHLDAVLPQITRLSRMARRVRRIGRDAEDLLQEVDLATSVREVVSLLDYSWRLDGYVTECDLQEGVPPVAGSADALQQVWFNLLKNAYEALEAAGRDKGRIVVRLRRCGEQVELVIADNGVGVASERLDALREPKPFQSDKAFGMGLGLCEAYRIVRSMGGVWEVESRPGKGTAFRLRFPLGDPAECGGSILVVDDEDSVGRQVARFLESRGYRADVAAGGLEGLELGLARRYDLVVFDVLMPGIDGPEMMAEIARASGADNLAGIAITADPDFRSERYPVLRKPLRLEDLAAEVGRLLGAAQESLGVAEAGQNEGTRNKYMSPFCPRSA